MRLREDPTASSALRLALEDDPSELPSAVELTDLADVLNMRLCQSTPARLASRADTPRLLREALQSEPPPALHQLADIWEGIEKAVDSGAPVRPIFRKPRPRVLLIATSVVTVSALAAAGFNVLRDNHANIELPLREATHQSHKREQQAHQRLPASHRPSPAGLQAPPTESHSAAKPEEAALAVRTTLSTSGAAQKTAIQVAAAKVPTLPNVPFSHRTEEVPMASQRTGSVVAEISLLRPAWTELRAGRAQAALTIAREHATRYPTGALAQEREILIIDALTMLGNTTEARARAADFERRFPDSPHRPQLHHSEPVP